MRKILRRTLLAVALVIAAGVIYGTIQQQYPWLGLPGPSPSEDYLAQIVIAPFNQTMPYTIGKLASRYASRPNLATNWNRDPNGDWIFHAAGTDPMTGLSVNLAMRISGATVVAITYNGEYLNNYEILATLTTLAAGN
jgi:hypothetical protein